MNNYINDIKILEKVINNEYSLKKILELYSSNKYSPFSIPKKVKIFISVVLLLVTILFILNYLLIISILWVLLTTYFFYLLWITKWYNLWAEEWLMDWFQQWIINNQLIILKNLLENKRDNFKEPEKALLNILTISLSNKFRDYNNYYKDENNKQMIEFELYKIIENEIKIYDEKWFIN